MPQINWKAGHGKGPTLNFLEFYEGLVQCVDFETRNKNILDLILSADSHLITNIKGIASHKSGDHCLITFKMKISSEKQGIRSALDFKNAYETAINREILYLDWNNALHLYPNAEELYKFFICFVHELTHKYIPVKKITLGGKGIPYHIGNRIKQKERIWKDLKHNPS